MIPLTNGIILESIKFFLFKRVYKLLETTYIIFLTIKIDVYRTCSALKHELREAIAAITSILLSLSSCKLSNVLDCYIFMQSII